MKINCILNITKAYDDCKMFDRKTFSLFLLTRLSLLSVTLFLFDRTYAQTLEQDSLSLVALYNNTNDNDWTNNTNWLTTQPLSTWHGVTVFDGRVLFLDLVSNNLSGTLPPEIGDLTQLDSLHLTCNNISGEILSEIGNLTNLRLTTNQLTGSVPMEMANLLNLYTLSVSFNNMSDDVPMEIFDMTKMDLNKQGYTLLILMRVHFQVVSISTN